MCKQLVNRLGGLKSDWTSSGFPDDVRLLLAAVDRFSQAVSELCFNLQVVCRISLGDVIKWFVLMSGISLQQ